MISKYKTGQMKNMQNMGNETEEFDYLYKTQKEKSSKRWANEKRKRICFFILNFTLFKG